METKDILKKRLAQLPPRLRDAIINIDLSPLLQDIAAAHKLHIDQAGAVEDETILVLLGLTPMPEYESALVENAHISSETAETIAQEMNEKVFAELREHLEEAAQIEMEHIPSLDAEAGLSETEIAVPQFNLPHKTQSPAKNQDAREEPRHYSLPHFGRSASNAATEANKATPDASATPSAGKQLENTESALSIPTEKGKGQQISPPPTNSQPAQNSAPQEPASKPKSYPVDPYREPVE